MCCLALGKGFDGILEDGLQLYWQQMLWRKVRRKMVLRSISVGPRNRAPVGCLGSIKYWKLCEKLSVNILGFRSQGPKAGESPMLVHWT